MARLRRPASPPSDASKVLTETLNEAIASGVMKDLCLETAAPIMTQARRSKDGQYRTTSVNRGEEFMPAGVRLGARGDVKIIFEFRPVDPNTEFEQFELDDTKVWTAFPDLENLVVRAMGFEAVDTDGHPVRFDQIKPKFLDAAREKVKFAEQERKRKEEEKKNEAEKRENKHYETHPLFGTWG